MLFDKNAAGNVDISIAKSKIRFEEYTNTWNLDLHASIHFSLVILQICVANDPANCIVCESNIAPRNCSEIDMNNAQILLGSVLLQPIIYIL